MQAGRRQLLLVAVLLVLAGYSSAMTLRDPAATAPDTIPSAFPNAKPVWVAAEVAFDRAGALRKEYFDEGAISAIENYRQMERAAERSSDHPADCVHNLTGSGPELTMSVSTDDDLARNSRAVMKGEIVGGRQGFYFGMPGTLYTVRVSERLKDVGGISTASTVYLFVEQARIETATGLICARPASAALIPQIGDRVLVFAVFDSADAAHSIIPIDINRTIVIQHGDRLAVPVALRKLPAKNVDEIGTAIARKPAIQQLPSKWEGQQ